MSTDESAMAAFGSLFGREIGRGTIAGCLLSTWIAWAVYQHYRLKVYIPVVGVPPGLFGGLKATFQFFFHGSDWIVEGYRKYSPTGTTFKIASIARYIVFPTSPKIIEEVMLAPDHVMSFREAVIDLLAMDWTFHPSAQDEKRSKKLIQTKLTQRLSTILPEIADELALSWRENTEIGNEWTRVRVWDVMLQVVARTTSRMYVGVPLCRNQEYLDNMIEYSVKVGKFGAILDITPRLLRRPLAYLLMNQPLYFARLQKHVGHIFRERKQKMRELGPAWKDRPDDLIQWILDLSGDSNCPDGELMGGLQVMSFLAIHTTTATVTHALYDIAANPHLQPALSTEITDILTKDGMSKQSLTKMEKLDSVIRESQRLNPIATATMIRKVLVPHTLSDGTHLPAGAWIAAPTAALQRLNSPPDSTFFDGFRWERSRDTESKVPRRAAVTTSLGHLPFGHGKHACPGRFFAVTELKILLSHIIQECEIRCVEGQGRPQNLLFGMSCLPDLQGELEFRRRR